MRKIEVTASGSGYKQADRYRWSKDGLSPGDIDFFYYVIGILGMALITRYLHGDQEKAVGITDVIQSVLCLFVDCYLPRSVC